MLKFVLQILDKLYGSHTKSRAILYVRDNLKNGITQNQN